MFRNLRVLVALSDRDVDDELLAHARLIQGIGVAGEMTFVHVAKPDASAATVAEARENIASRLRSDPAAFSPTDRSLVIATGIRTDVLIEEASKSRADLILLGHRSERSGHRSLARRLAMAAPCSIWLAPQGAPAAIRRVLAPVDFSDHSAEALRVAAAIAGSSSAKECTALHVAFDPTVVGYDEHVDEVHHDEQRRFWEFLADNELGAAGIRAQCEDGPEPSRTILRVAEERQSELIVMSTRGRSRAAAVLLGSVTARVIERSPISVLAVKHSGAFLGLFDVLKQSAIWSLPNPKTN